MSMMAPHWFLRCIVRAEYCAKAQDPGSVARHPEAEDARVPKESALVWVLRLICCTFARMLEIPLVWAWVSGCLTGSA
jgi:hypothetical protein